VTEGREPGQVLTEAALSPSDRVRSSGACGPAYSLSFPHPGFADDAGPAGDVPDATRRAAS